MSFKSMVLASALGLSGLIAAGCQSSSNGDPHAGMDMSSQAVMCSKCQVTYVKVPASDSGGKPGRMMAYSTRKVMECPDCKSAAANFFATGKLEHTCKTCGDSLSICEAH